MPGFKASRDRRILLLGIAADGDLKLKSLLIYQSKTPKTLRIILNLPCLCSINGTTSLNDSISVKTWCIDILSPLLRTIAQKKIPFKIQLIDNAPGPPRALMEMQSEINSVFMPADTTYILQPMD